MEKRPERRGLGRGLSALMADIARPEAPEAIGSTVPRRTDTLPVEQLEPNPNQPRRQFAEEDLRNLADSIRVKGVLQPLIVRAGAVPGRYEIVAGERRWRAAQIAQVHEVPVLIRDLDDTEVLEVAIIENIQRADLNPIEEALAFRQLMDRFGHTQEKLAEALSKTRSYIANLLRLLNLPADVQNLVSEGQLSGGHARALITASDQLGLAQRIVREGLSVRATEDLVRNQEGRPQTQRKKVGDKHATDKDADTIGLEMDLAANLNMQVVISHEPGGESGILTVKYQSLDDLDFLCQVLSMARRDAM